MSQASSLNILELTGTQHNLELIGRALPYRPMTFEGTMQAEFCWYPGNPIATVQMIGARESATTINGMWKDRFIKTTTDQGIPLFNPPGKAKYDGLTVLDVHDLVTVVDGFRMRGQLLALTWDEMTRHGIMKRFRHTWLRREDVEWEMEFDWISRGEEEMPIAFASSIPGLDLINELLDAYNNLVDSIKSIFAMVDDIQNLLNNALDAITTAVGQAQNLAKQFQNAVMYPLQMAQSLKAAYETIKDECGNIINTVTSVPGRALRKAKDIAGISESESVEAEMYSRTVRKAARKMRSLAAQRQQELAAKTSDQPAITTITARADQDLRAVSKQAYGTPNEWQRIAAYNHISGSKAPTGKVLLIPKLSNAPK